MKDIYVPKKVPRIEVREKLHGHTRIDLFDTKTGKHERVEHDNMFTDGILDFCKSDGIASNARIFSTGSGGRVSGRVWTKLLGGILLFDTALPTDPVPRFMPAGITMTANGSYGVSNSGTVTELGSYNSAESVSTNDSATLVYDWLTSQGNGTIASIALTTDIGGYIGYGNASSQQRHGNKKTYWGESSSPWNDTYSRAGNINVPNNVIYKTPATIRDDTLWGASPKSDSEYSANPYVFKTYGYYCPTETVDIFKPQFSSTPVKELSVTFPIKPRYIWSLGFDRTGKVAYITSTASDYGIYANKDFYVGIIDTVNETSEVFTVTAPFNIDVPLALYFDDTYLYVPQNSKRLNYRTNTWESYTDFAMSYQNGPFNLYFTDELYTYSNGWIYDPILKRRAPINNTDGFGGVQSNGWYYTAGYDGGCKEIIQTEMSASNNTLYVYLTKHPCRLMTINNLNAPVVKTADKTMKVTYTITRSS